MADTPPTAYALEFAGSGNVQVFPVFGTQVLGSQIGSDVGTGGPALATLETISVAVSSPAYVHNRVIEFLDDVYCLAGEGNASNTIGVYKRNQGGIGAWGRVHTPSDGFGGKSGLHIMHPNDTPTLVFLSQGNTNGDVYLHTTTDGTTWNETNVLADTPSTRAGYSCVYRNILFWLTGSDIYQYNFDTTSCTRATVGNPGQLPAYPGGPIHVHNNIPYAMWINTGITGAPLKLFRYSGGTFGNTSNGEIYSWNNATPDSRSGTGGCLFTDPASGDLIALTNTSSVTVGTQVWVVNNPEGVPTTTNITSTVMGAIQGAVIYTPGSGGAYSNRKWQIFYDNDTDPTNPRIYFRTWESTNDPGASVWQWQGTGAEMQRVSLSTISGDNFARVVTTRGGGNFFVGGGARAEIDDGANPPTEVPGGTKWYFRVYGTGTGTIRAYYNTSELAPNTLCTLTGAVTVESGSPATTPSRSGNTIINVTGDDGATLYSFIHAATNDGISPGDTFTLMLDIS